MDNKSILFSAHKADNIRLKHQNRVLAKENKNQQDLIASLRFQLRIAKEKIERRNQEICELMKHQIVDLTTPNTSPIKEKPTLDTILHNYFSSYMSDDEEAKEEEVYYDTSNKKRKYSFSQS